MAIKEHQKPSVRIASHSLCFLHDPGIGQPESVFRLRAVERGLQKYGYAWKTEDVSIAIDSIRAVHGKEYLLSLDDVVKTGSVAALDSETFASSDSIRAAYMSASICCDLVERVLSHEIDVGFACVRPPGHHALPNGAMGYCIVNNIAVAAHHALQNGAKKVAILDLDVHHGNGTQAWCSGNKQILHIDLHEDALFPEGSGAVEECGSGDAVGNIINIPMPNFSGGKEYQKVFSDIVFPVLGAFAPDLVLVSAGYDAHAYDGLSSLRLTYRDFYDLYSALSEWAIRSCSGRIVCMLEGGYSVAALESSVPASIAALSNDVCPNIPVYPMRNKTILGFSDMVESVKQNVVQKYWVK